MAESSFWKYWALMLTVLFLLKIGIGYYNETNVKEAAPLPDITPVMTSPQYYTPAPTPEAEKYTWEINYYGFEGGNNLGILKFENEGTADLCAVKFKFEFYRASGDFYNEIKVDVGNVTAGQSISKKVALPAKYYGYETWSKKKIFVTVNGGAWEEQNLESYE